MAESIQLIRQIAVRAIVTENFKDQVNAEIERNLQQIDAELQQLEFKGKRAIADIEKEAQGMDSEEARYQIESIRQQVEQEKIRLFQLKEEMQGQSQALKELPVGSVVTQFTVENPVEVRIGENIFQRLEGGEILVKDGVIQEIRL
ncbi:MAG: YlqD family protein [Cyanobacteriota/Melainabacteria group bacterium]|nr:YlqD family protein [Cyanobacteria bacterium HKST-UBA01]MCB9470835.1 YlqD family protein [Candidatus Obscuribacterales bacterium]